MNRASIVSQLKKERDRLDNAIQALEGVGSQSGPERVVYIAEEKDFYCCPEAHSSGTEKALGGMESEAKE